MVRSPSAIALAAENLRRFDVVGRLDNLTGFAADVQAKLGFRLRVGHENRSPALGGGLRFKDLTPDQMQKVRVLCAPDIAVWNRAS